MNCLIKAFNKNWVNSTPTQYADILRFHPQLALVTILQAYTGASDAEAIEALTMDRRWQLVVNCLDCEQPPFVKQR